VNHSCEIKEREKAVTYQISEFLANINSESFYTVRRMMNSVVIVISRKRMCRDLDEIILPRVHYVDIAEIMEEKQL